MLTSHLHRNRGHHFYKTTRLLCRRPPGSTYVFLLFCVLPLRYYRTSQMQCLPLSYNLPFSFVLNFAVRPRVKGLKDSIWHSSPPHQTDNWGVLISILLTCEDFS